MDKLDYVELISDLEIVNQRGNKTGKIVMRSGTTGRISKVLVPERSFIVTFSTGQTYPVSATQLKLLPKYFGKEITILE